MINKRNQTAMLRAAKLTFWIGILLAAPGNLLTVETARADSYPSLNESLQYLENRYHLSVEDLARYLSATGPNIQDQTQSRLVRWEDKEFHVSIVVAGAARDEARLLAKNMIALFDQIHRRSKVCLQNIESPDVGDGYTPSASELECINQQYEILVVVDASSPPAVKLLDDLSQISSDDVARKFWIKQAHNQSAQPESSNCDAGYSIDPDVNLLLSGTIYLRLAPSVPNSQVLDACLAILPFRILGVPPIPVAGYRETFDSRLLLMMYSPELHPGMGAGEIERMLRQ